jgi:hypothetical protein
MTDPLWHAADHDWHVPFRSILSTNCRCLSDMASFYKGSKLLDRPAAFCYGFKPLICPAYMFAGQPALTWPSVVLLSTPVNYSGCTQCGRVAKGSQNHTDPSCGWQTHTAGTLMKMPGRPVGLQV